MAMAKRITEFMPKSRLEEVTVLSWDELSLLQKVAESKAKPAIKKPTPAPRDGEPLPNRLAKADSHYHVGDDQQGGKIFQICDSPMDRLYARLIRSASSHQENALRKEYAALSQYRHHWHQAGLEPTIGSVDLDRIFAPDASNMSGMAKTERQHDHRVKYREAREELLKSMGNLIGHRAGIVLDNVVCCEWNLEIAGYSVGYGSYKKTDENRTYASPYRAREEATKLLRAAAVKLADHWGMT